jgi:predicted MFS family arabinose efflux permease
MKRVIAITFVNYFVSGGLTLTIPLLLLDRNVNLAEIGIVISIMPLVFLLVRLLFAALADQVGWAPFFILLNWPATLISTAIYFLANSISAFTLGKIVEGVKEASYWAVNRTAIFSLSPKQEEKEATRINAVIWLSTAAGSAAAGVGIAYVGFSSTLGIMIMASAILAIPAALLWNTGKRDSKPKISSAIALLDPRGRDRTFWLVSLTLLFNSLATYPLITLLLPVFMDQQLGYDYVSIGVAFMLYNVVASVVTLSTLKTRPAVGRVVIQCVIGLLATFLLTNSGFYFPALFLALAVTRGLGIGFFESIIAKVTKNRRTVSVDIGLLHIPTRLAEFASVLSAGFVAQFFGYMPIFAASGIFFTVFSLLSFYTLRQES